MVTTKGLRGLRCAAVGLAAVGLTAAGCGDDDGGGAGGAGGGATTAASSTSTTSAATTGSGATTGAGTGTGGDGSGGSATGGGGQGGEGAGAPGLHLAMVRGTLFTDDLEEAQARHDAIASEGEEAARSAGDVAHDALLSTDALGAVPGLFLGVDRWTDAAAMGAFYSDPAIQEAFGTLFAAPPTLETFAHQATWHAWGDLDVADDVTPHFWAVVRGRLASDDLAEMQALHDGIAAGGQGAAEALGDLAHVVFLGTQDERELLAIDVWDNPEGPVALYTDPDFGAAFAQLFEAPPSLVIHVSTDWHQW